MAHRGFVHLAVAPLQGARGCTFLVSFPLARLPGAGGSTVIEDVVEHAPREPLPERALRAFNQPLNNWNVSNVEYMNSMFTFANSFNEDVKKHGLSSDVQK